MKRNFAQRISFAKASAGALMATALLSASCGPTRSAALVDRSAAPIDRSATTPADRPADSHESANAPSDFSSLADQTKKVYFDAYILKAVDLLYAKYKMLGYDLNELYTHDLMYGTTTIAGTPGPKTMCVAAQVEVILTAMELYVQETGDKSVYDFLPAQSWRGLTINDIKGHIWVNSKYNSYGTPDALAHFGMGEVTTFEKLKPGAFINFSRTTNSGHAVTFIAYIDKDGKEYDTYNANVIGFKYFSAQGIKDPSTAGLDFRYAVFSKFGCPDMPYKNDCNVIYSTSRSTLESGRMWAPVSWKHVHPKVMNAEAFGESVLNTHFYTGE